MTQPFITQEEALALMRQGWELGYFDGIRSDGCFRLQQNGLCKGGPTRKVRAGSVKALERKKLVALVPREASQPYWLHRYRLVENT